MREALSCMVNRWGAVGEGTSRKGGRRATGDGLKHRRAQLDKVGMERRPRGVGVAARTGNCGNFNIPSTEGAVACRVQSGLPTRSQRRTDHHTCTMVPSSPRAVALNTPLMHCILILLQLRERCVVSVSVTVNATSSTEVSLLIRYVHTCIDGNPILLFCYSNNGQRDQLLNQNVLSTAISRTWTSPRHGCPESVIPQ